MLSSGLTPRRTSMPHRKLLISPLSAVLTILLLGLFSAAAPALRAQEGEAEDVVLERDPRPKLFATDITFIFSFQCLESWMICSWENPSFRSWR